MRRTGYLLIAIKSCIRKYNLKRLTIPRSFSCVCLRKSMPLRIAPLLRPNQNLSCRDIECDV